MISVRDLRRLACCGALLLTVGCGDPGPTDTEVLPPQGRAFDAPAPTAVAEAAERDPLDVAGDASPSEAVESDVTSAAPVAATDSSSAEGEESAPVPAKDGDVREVSFAVLAAFEYEPEDPFAMLGGEQKEVVTEIPESVQALSGEYVTIDGYLMPTLFESGKVQQFLLTRSYITCCFGDVLKYNEVVDVTVKKGLEVSYFLSGQPVSVTGYLEVGEKKSEFGYVESIYRIVAEKVEERW